MTELSHVVQVRVEGPKAPSPGHRPLPFPSAGDRWFRAYGTKLAKLEQMKKYIDGKEYYKYRCTCHR